MKWQVYRIKNIKNEKCYFGTTCKSFSERYPGDKWYKTIMSQNLIWDLIEFGETAFEITENLFIFESESEAKQKEQDLIQEYKTNHPSLGYNINLPPIAYRIPNMFHGYHDDKELDRKVQEIILLQGPVGEDPSAEDIIKRNEIIESLLIGGVPAEDLQILIFAKQMGISFSHAARYMAEIATTENHHPPKRRKKVS